MKIRMKASVVIALLSTIATAPTNADPAKPLPTQAAEAMQPFVKQFSDTTSRAVNDYMAGMTGPLGDAARRNQKISATSVAVANRSTRKSMTECVKPGDLIDQDVKECIEGKRTKDW